MLCSKAESRSPLVGVVAEQDLRDVVNGQLVLVGGVGVHVVQGSKT